MKLRATGTLSGLAGTLFGTLLVGLTVNRVSAELPQPVERLGRLYGVGWGDGYQACKSSGCCVLRDLPPVSNRIRLIPPRPPVAPAPRGVITYYDRFDAADSCAANVSCDAAEADAPVVPQGGAVDATRPPEDEWLLGDPVIQPPVADPAVAASNPEPDPLPQESEPVAADRPQRLRPYRPAPPDPQPQRPVRLGLGSSQTPSMAVNANPFAMRPAVELAERVADRSGQVIRQPTQRK